MTTSIVFIVIGLVVFFLSTLLIMMFSWHKKVPPEHALVRTGAGGIRIALNQSIFIIPQLHQQYTIDLKLKRILVNCINQNAVRCRDGTLADIKAHFYIKVNPNAADVVKAMQEISCSIINDLEALNNLFAPKFTEAVKVVASRSNLRDLQVNTERFKLDLLNYIGMDLNGMVLDDVAIDYIEKS